MKEIKLTQGLTTQVDDDDFDYLNQWNWYAHKDSNTFYVDRVVWTNKSCKTIKMHRIIMNTTDGVQVDHRDHNGLNNQKSNLRNCTISENNRNSCAFGRSKYRGVSYTSCIKNGKRYEYITASIKVNKKHIGLGVFKTEEAAARAYDEKAKELHGEFANLNFKEDN